MEEKELVQATKSGDEGAFSLLVKKYQSRVFNMALSFTRNRQVADDLAQEIFIKAYFGLPRFKFKSEFGTWLYRITVNQIKDHLRKKVRVKEVSLNDVAEPSIAQKENGAVEKKEKIEEQKREILHRLIQELPEKSKIILILRDIQGFSYEDISKILHVSMGTVDSRLFRARKMLRNKFKAFLREKGGEYEM